MSYDLYQFFSQETVPKITRKYTIYSAEKGIIGIFFRVKNQNNCKFVAESSFMSKFIDIHTHRPTGRAIEPTAVGVHPWDAASRSVAEVESLVATAEIVGEIGLDKVCNVDFERQIVVFREQLSLAERFSKPVVIHCVRTFEQVMKILADYHLRAVIFHGFIGSPEQAKRAVERGYFLSFGEPSFASPRTVLALEQTPLSNLFLESDDRPVTIDDIYAKAAVIKRVTMNELEDAILENYNSLNN